MKTLIHNFSRLRAKLTITYTLVTVSALIAVEIVLIALVVTIFTLTDSYKRGYIGDVIYFMSIKASGFLDQPSPDVTGLQNWLQQEYDSGYASQQPNNSFDSPAAPIIPDSSIYVASPAHKILMRIPNKDNQEPYKTLTFDNPELKISEEIIDEYEMSTYQTIFLGDPLKLQVDLEDGSILVVIPVLDNNDKVILAYLFVNIASPPSALRTLGPLILASIVITAILLLVIITPFGTLFGFIMSSSLTRRIGALSKIVKVWGQDDFSQMPNDRSADEIGELARNLEKMAVDFQMLIQTQQELSILEERNRLARELHDTVKQQVFATLMQVRAAKNLTISQPATSIQHLGEAEHLLKESQKELSLMINELRPGNTVEEQNLAKILSGYLERWETQSGIQTNFITNGQGEIQVVIRQNIFRVFQEALSNISKHSRATEVRVQLSFFPTQLMLEIEDNGIGFTPEETNIRSTGFGLESMHQRIQKIQGTLEITSVLKRGTQVKITAPSQWRIYSGQNQYNACR